MTSTLTHEAFVYDSDEEFVDWLEPFIVDGVENGDEVMVVTRSDNRDRLRDVLGQTQAAVRFVDSTDWYRSPVRTIAGYQSTMDEAFSRGVARLRVVGEVEFGSTEIEHAEWTRYESVINTAFGSRPAWIVCPYDARRLPSRVLEDASHTHPQTIRGRARRINDTFDPQAGVTSLPVAVSGRPVEELRVDGDLRPVRELARRTSHLAGFSEERVEQVSLVLNEIATNAILHGRPPVEVRAWVDQPRVVFEVEDTGPGPSDPLLGLIPPEPTQLGGKGLWVARQLADRPEISSGTEGTLVRFAAEPAVA